MNVESGLILALAVWAAVIIAGACEVAAWLRRPRPGATPDPARPPEIQRGATIDVPGPPCRATVRCHNHAFWEGQQLRTVEYTEFCGDIQWTGAAVRVATPEWHSELGRFYAAQDVQVGDEAFDRRYVILSNPAKTARDLLDATSRNRIRRLDTMAIGGFLLMVRPRTLLVRVGRRLSGRFLQIFIEECQELARRVLELSPTEGMEIQSVGVGADAECQVCGTKIEPAKRVLCGKCRTPHHGDCWAYNDGCSVFACGERRSVKS